MAADGQHCFHCGLPVPAARAGGDASFCCFGCSVAAALNRQSGNGRGGNPYLVRLGLGIFLTLNLMVFNWLFYSGELFGPAARSGEAYREMAELFAYLQLLLATVVMAVIGLPVLHDALLASRLRRPHSEAGSHFSPRIEPNLLISIAVGSAFVVSAAHVMTGSGPLYFETVAGVLVLLTLGNYLEAAARRKATAAVSLTSTLPRTVTAIREGRRLELAVTDLRKGDLVRTRPGETVAVDGVVRTGLSHIQSSALTGESAAQSVGPSDTVLAGSGVVDGELWIEASEAGAGRVLARMEQLLEQARRGRQPLERLTARIALFFTPVMLTLALVLVGWHILQGDFSEGLLIALSVLLISCPCALGLAAPLAGWTAIRRAADEGALITSCESLERAARVDRVFFDKTGTLTSDEPRVEAVDLAAGLTLPETLSLAAAVEAPSLHPIGTAVVDLARRRGIDWPAAEGFRLIAGVGVEATVDGRRLKLGSERLLHGPEAPRTPSEWDEVGEGRSGVYLAEGRRLLARFQLAETLRPDAGDSIARLQQLGVEVEMLTGDTPAAAQRLGRLLGIPAAGSLLTADKIRRISAARRRGETTAMVGDGVNDAAVLAASNLGVSVASATDLTRSAADVVLRRPSLLGVARTIELGRRALTRIRITLCWAFTYNLVGVGLAAAGLLSPLFAASAMVVSSLLIIRLATTPLPAPAGVEAAAAAKPAPGAAPQPGVTVG